MNNACMLPVQWQQETQRPNNVETILLKIAQFGPTTLIIMGGIFLLFLIIYLETGFFVGLIAIIPALKVFGIRFRRRNN